MNQDNLGPVAPWVDQRLSYTPSGSNDAHPIVVVLGMHRSGTSLCAHILSALGVDMADQLAGLRDENPLPDNPKGHWERWEIVELHDRILNCLHRSYASPLHDISFPPAWWADPHIAVLRREITSFLRKRIRDQSFGFKDPRTIRLLPMWFQIFEELKLTPKFVMCLRNPAQVTRSLNARDGTDIDIGELRWFNYMMDFFQYAGHSNFVVIEYEDWFFDPRTNIEKLLGFLHLGEFYNQVALELTVSEIVDHSIRHDDAKYDQPRQSLVRAMYDLARRSGVDVEARDEIMRLVAVSARLQQLNRPLHRAFERQLEAMNE